MNRQDRAGSEKAPRGAAYSGPGSPAPRKPKYAAALFLSFFSAYRGWAAVLALVCLCAPALAAAEDQEGPLTQADIDAYVYLAPRLFGEIMNYPDKAVKLLNEVNLTRRRAIYITAKIPLTQALARGLITPGQLMDIPANLHPTIEEVQLVNSNLLTLMQAESTVIDASGVKVPRKWRKAPGP